MRSFFYSIKQAFVQINRNRTMTVTSLFSITAMLLILGMFFVVAVNLNLLTQSAKDQFDMVEIYIADDTSDENITAMRDSLLGLSYVSDVEYLDKEDAMAEMKARWGDNGYLLDNLSQNPLPRSLRVTLKNIEDSQKVVDYARAFTGIEEVKYGQSEVEKILKITNAIQIGALIIIVFLIIVSVIVVSNTVKLTVLARGREISIMKYVGATNWFIRGPFLAEGILIGLMAALISSGIITGLYSLIESNMSEKFLVMLSTEMVPESFLSGNLMIIFIALGVSIGAIGSLISMRRFLDT
ncbi:MAG: permease-like cell division protein FtsX [Clostridia bacterium]|nr:permease-like cell division protein FtsX [Clostridia bacterium]